MTPKNSKTGKKIGGNLTGDLVHGTIPAIITGPVPIAGAHAPSLMQSAATQQPWIICPT